MDVYKINAIKQRIEVISQGSAKVKLELYIGLLESSIGAIGLYDNIIDFLEEEETKRATGNSSVSASASEANISMPSAVSAPIASSSTVSAPSANRGGGAIRANKAFKLPETPVIVHGLGSRPLVPPISLKKRHRKTRRRNRQ